MRLRAGTVAFACHEKACAPPPAGKGGSSKGAKSKTKPKIDINDVLSRMFIGPPNSKGRQKMYLATKEGAEAYRKAHPPTPPDTRRRVTRYH